MSKHAPGPWVARRWYVPTPGSSQGSKLLQECFICDGNGRKLAEVFAPEVVDVIEAAPQLLQALENCRSKILSMLMKAGVFEEDALECWEIVEADAAIAKAKGEQA